MRLLTAKQHPGGEDRNVAGTSRNSRHRSTLAACPSTGLGCLLLTACGSCSLTPRRAGGRAPTTFLGRTFPIVRFGPSRWEAFTRLRARGELTARGVRVTAKRHPVGPAQRTLLWADGSIRRRCSSAAKPRTWTRCKRWCWSRGLCGERRRDSEAISRAIYPTDRSHPDAKWSWPSWIRTTINGSKERQPVLVTTGSTTQVLVVRAPSGPWRGMVDHGNTGLWVALWVAVLRARCSGCSVGLTIPK